MTSTQRRDETIRKAINRGCFSEKRAEVWRRAWDADPAGTERTIASLASTDPATFAPAPAGPVTAAEMSALFPGSYSPPQDAGGTSAVSEDEMLALFPGQYHPMEQG